MALSAVSAGALLLPVLAAGGGDGSVRLDCYLRQSGALGLGQFVRHLEVRPEQGVVIIADSIGGGPASFVGQATVVALDSGRLVYRFASASSAGQAEIDRRSGAFRYSDGRRVITGRCEEAGG